MRLALLACHAWAFGHRAAYSDGAALHPPAHVYKLRSALLMCMYCHLTMMLRAGNVSVAWIKKVAAAAKDGSQPFMAYIAPKAAHEPFNPAPW